jgi:hypothetical protein
MPSSTFASAVIDFNSSINAYALVFGTGTLEGVWNCTTSNALGVTNNAGVDTFDVMQNGNVNIRTGGVIIQGQTGVTFVGSPTSSFSVVGGIVVHQ